MDAGNYGPIGRLISPPFRPVKVTQTCLIFSYRVTVGTWNIEPSLTVYFGGIPHWNTSKGEGRAVIGLYKLNATSNVGIMSNGFCYQEKRLRHLSFVDCN